jgi:type II secretory pathway predicted ATPase ExeA
MSRAAGELPAGQDDLPLTRFVVRKLPMFLEFYGLNEQPFGVTPDPRFLYLGPAQQEAFSSLVYGIEAAADSWRSLPAPV